MAIRGTRQHDCLRWQKTALQEPPARAEDFRKNTRRHLAKLVTAFDKSRSKAEIREVAVETVLGGSGSDARRLQKSETATASWPAAAKFWAMTYFDVVRRSTAVYKAGSKAGMREVAVTTILGGSGNDVCRLQQSDTATVSWPAAAKFWAKNYCGVAQRSTAAHKARSKGGIRDVAVKTVLGGSGNGVRRLQQSETATVPWLAAPKFWAMNYFDVAQQSTVAHKARNIAGIREVAVKTVLGGSDNEVCRLQQIETATVSWRAAAECWAMTYFGIAQRSTAVEGNCWRTIFRAGKFVVNFRRTYEQNRCAGKTLRRCRRASSRNYFGRILPPLL